MKYTTYIDINAGDKIKFTDGSIKTIVKVKDSHIVWFDQEKNCRDLYTLDACGLIEEVIPTSETVKTTAKTVIPCSLSILDELFAPVVHEKDKVEEVDHSYLTYSELFSLMDKGDKTGLDFSKHFWHYTSNSNLISIVKSGYFKARSFIEGNIPYDLREHNETEKEVQKTNRSYKTMRHVRFYLRPLNMPFFNAFVNLPPHEKNNFVIVSIDRGALIKSNNPTFLYPFNAHSASDDVFNYDNKLNHHFSNKFKLYNFSDFDFVKIYSQYNPDPEQDLHTKRCQQAEFLVSKDLSIKYIDRIYFFSKPGMESFLSNIKELDDYNIIKDKCVVDYNGNIFGYTYDKYYR